MQGTSRKVINLFIKVLEFRNRVLTEGAGGTYTKRIRVRSAAKLRAQGMGQIRVRVHSNRLLDEGPSRVKLRNKCRYNTRCLRYYPTTNVTYLFRFLFFLLLLISFGEGAPHPNNSPPQVNERNETFFARSLSSLLGTTVKKTSLVREARCLFAKI